MKEFWQKSQQRGRETVTFWRQFRPDITIGGTSPDALAAEIARLEPLAQAVAAARVAAKMVKHRELAAFARLRALNLNVPLLIAGQFDADTPVRAALAAVQAVTPETDALNLLRARRLIPVWRRANAALAARQPGAAITRAGVSVAEFAKFVADYPQALQATADAVAAFRAARTVLRAQHGVVDGWNKRIYKRFQAEAYADAALAAALPAGITREKPSGARSRGDRGGRV